MCVGRRPESRRCGWVRPARSTRQKLPDDRARPTARSLAEDASGLDPARLAPRTSVQVRRRSCGRDQEPNGGASWRMTWAHLPIGWLGRLQLEASQPIGDGACDESRVRALPAGGINSCTERLARSLAIPCGYGRSIVALGKGRGPHWPTWVLAASVTIEESPRGGRGCIGLNCRWPSTAASWRWPGLCSSLPLQPR